jgi:serine/threonine protein kinase
LNKKKVL